METPNDGAAIAPEDGQGAAITPEDGGTGSWLDTIPETETFTVQEDGQEIAKPLREHPKLKEFKTPAELAKSLLNQEKLLGKKTLGITPLKEGATDEERADWDKEFRRVMSVPEKPEDYSFQFPEGTQVDEGMAGWFRESAHKHGMPPAMAQGVAADFAEHSNTYWAAEFKRMEESEKENLQRITQHFGGEEKTAEASELAKRGFEAAAKAAGLNDEEVAAFRKVHGNDMTFVRLFHQIGLRSGKEDQQVNGGGGGGGGTEETSEDRYKKHFKE